MFVKSMSACSRCKHGSHRGCALTHHLHSSLVKRHESIFWIWKRNVIHTSTVGTMWVLKWIAEAPGVTSSSTHFVSVSTVLFIQRFTHSPTPSSLSSPRLSVIRALICAYESACVMEFRNTWTFSRHVPPISARNFSGSIWLSKPQNLPTDSAKLQKKQLPFFLYRPLNRFQTTIISFWLGFTPSTVSWHDARCCVVRRLPSTWCAVVGLLLPATVCVCEMWWSQVLILRKLLA